MCNKTPLHIYLTQENMPWATTDYKEVPNGSVRQIVITTKEEANKIMENLSILEDNFPNTLSHLRKKNNGKNS